jgi:uncharacterized protein
VIAMLGKRGTGKSYTLGVLLEGLAVAVPVSSIAAAGARATLVLDVLDIFWSTALPLVAGGPPELERQYARMGAARLEPSPLSVDVWIPAGFEDPAIDLPQTQVFRLDPSQMTAEDWTVLFDFDLLIEPRGMLIEELVRKVTRTGWTDSAGVQYSATPKYSVEDLLQCLRHDAAIVNAYADSTVRAVTQRLSSAALNPLFQGVPTQLSAVLQRGRASIMMLGRLPDAAKQLVATFLTRHILKERQIASFARKRLDLAVDLPLPESAALEAQVQNSIPRTWLLIDEAQVLVPAGGKTVCGEMLIKYAKEGRNLGLSMAVTTQQPSAVNERLMSQVETLFVHQLTTKADLDVALHILKSPEPEEIIVNGARTSTADLMRGLEQGTALFSCANGGVVMPRATVVRIRPRISAHGGYEA